MVRKFILNILHNVHFWIIVGIIVAITFIYYNYSFMDNNRWEPSTFLWTLSLIEFQHHAMGSLYLIPVSYAAFIFRWRGAVIAWSISFGLIFPHILYYSLSTRSLVTNIFYALIPLLIVIIVNTELRWRARERQMLYQREEERQLYIAEILKAQENERRRIACELHDDSIQELVLLANKVDSLMIHNPKFSDNMELKRNGDWLRNEIIQVSQVLRTLSLELRPDILDNMGLVSALNWLASRLKDEKQINTSVRLNGSPTKIAREAEVMIFRVVQEALTNVKWHSCASKATIKLNFIPGFLRIEVEDNGKGFLVDEVGATQWIKTGHLGIIGMQQRTRLLNGTCNINSEPGRGTTVSIEIPASKYEDRPAVVEA